MVHLQLQIILFTILLFGYFLDCLETLHPLLPWIVEVLVESNLVFLIVEWLVMEAAEEVEKEGKEAETWHDKTICLPKWRVTTIWIVNVILRVLDQEEPKNTWDQVLDGETEVESKQWLPALNLIRLRSRQLRHRVGNLTNATHAYVTIPLAESQSGNAKGGQYAYYEDATGECCDAIDDFFEDDGCHADRNQVDPEGEGEILDGSRMSRRLVHRSLNIKTPSTSKALENSAQK